MRQLDPNGVLKFVWRPEMLSTLSKFNIEALAPLVGMKGENIHAILAEVAAFRESGLELARARPQSDLPLIVIMHGRRVLPRGALGDAMEDDWSALQKDLTARYRNSEFIIAEGSAHNVPLEQPELVIDALRKLVERYRSRGAFSCDKIELSLAKPVPRGAAGGTATKPIEQSLG
jgi:pimeloyl-ACP methyl ester carboxylesterase